MTTRARASRRSKGDQVLAVDAEYGIVLVRITGDGYRGVLAIVPVPGASAAGNGLDLWHGRGIGGQDRVRPRRHPRHER
ncbi:MAG: hypothetical protein ACLU3I_21925 [Acutalibacteraceae bacterium]